MEEVGGGVGGAFWKLWIAVFVHKHNLLQVVKKKIPFCGHKSWKFVSSDLKNVSHVD